MDIPRNWTFETSDIATNFDQHVREQLPWYDLATGAVAHIVRHYLPKNGLVYDIGASTGNIGRALSKVLCEREARLIPVEASAAMAQVYSGPGADELVCGDILDVEIEPFDVGVLFLTIMFIAPWKRAQVINRLRQKLRFGGAIIILDKTTNRGEYFGTVLSRLTLAAKVSSNIPAEAIIAKELSLSGVQRPISQAETSAWGGIEWFRFGDFAGWVIEQDFEK